MNTRHDEDYNFLFKIILVGDTGVGKTHLLSRYIKGSLPKNKFPTIGVEFATKPVPLKTGGTVKAQIWDTAGQERFKAITSAALIVYDITKEQSFQSVKKWMEEVKEHAEPDIVIMLVGNKLDICEKQPSERKVSFDRAEEFARENNIHFRETSAYTDHNVRDVQSFYVLVQEIYNVKSREDASARKNQGGKRLVHQDPSIEDKKLCGCM